MTIIVPEPVKGPWWGWLTHTNRERRLRARLLRHGGRYVDVSSIPWQLEPPDPAQAIAEEEPLAAPPVPDRAPAAPPAPGR